MFEIENLNSGNLFPCRADESVLDAADRAKIGLPYGCRKGDCGSCAADLVLGEVGNGCIGPREGMVFLCRAQPLSDLKIRVRELPWQAPNVVQRLPLRIIEKHVHGHTCILKLRIPKSATFEFHPGQYVGLDAPDGRMRYFSIASADAQEKQFELHINHVPGGLLTTEILTNKAKDDLLWMTGPYGDFRIPGNDGKTALLIAGGTGFAPIKACLEAIAKSDSATNSSYHLYWGVKSSDDFYDLPSIRLLCIKLPKFKVTPVSEFPDSSSPFRRSGPVHRAAMLDYPDMSDMDVFACGSPGMISAIAKDFTESCGMVPERYSADTFTLKQADQKSFTS